MRTNHAIALLVTVFTVGYTISVDAEVPNAKRILVREKSTDLLATSKAAMAKARKDWKPIASPRECTSNLAGYGKRAKAICFDFVNSGWRGPLMVVVPAGGEAQTTFAIGKHELSVGDYAKYCALSGTCKPETNKQKFNTPVTGISLADAEKYVNWLSERTNKTYRLPSKTEWEYAAKAGGKQPRKNVNNCSGTGMVSIKYGKYNGWGLKNYIGNVQEWVIEPSGEILALGGHFMVRQKECDISLSVEHNGQADNVTGFRVVMEMQ